MDFLCIFGAKTLDYRAKANCARYYTRILRKSLTLPPLPPPPNSICSSNCAFNIKQFFVFFAHYLHFSEITCLTQGTFLTILTGNLLCFQDYRAKKSKKCSILLGQFEEHMDFWGMVIKLFLKMCL